MRVFSFLAVVSAAVALPQPLLGQWPGEVRGTVHDAVTGSPVVGAVVGVESAPPSLTDTRGRFHLRSVPPGQAVLFIEAPGYVGVRLEITVANGQVARPTLKLQPSPFALNSIEARAPSAPDGGSVRVLDRAEIASSGARTLGDALVALPGVNVVDRGTGSAQNLSIRGSDADAVLVLVDGVPLNDPVSGVADLSVVPADAIEYAVLHVGASSSRFGPRATAGVLEITTGGTGAGWSAQAGAGSLGATDGRLEGAFDADDWSLRAAASHRTTGGSFDFTLPPEVGGGVSRRDNADHRLSTMQLHANLSGPTHAKISLSGDWLERGLPGPGFNPSTHARQEAYGGRAAVTVGQTLKSIALRSTAYVSLARQRFQDPQPPAGLPYDETSRLSEASAELGAVRTGDGVLTSSEVGVATRFQWIRSDALDDGIPDRFTELGLYGTAVFEPRVEGVQILTRGRVDRAGVTGTWHGSHALTLAGRRGPLAIELSHRSAFSPPTVADQFFREGVGTRPNPSLRAERIPSEFEANTRFEASSFRAGVGVFTGDVKDRIVWQPDFRFVWSPTNTDVRRKGLDAWAEFDPQGPLSVRGSYGFARVTYDREGSADSVQLAYRPRHTSTLSAAWDTETWHLTGSARRTGERFPVPAPVNALPAFWSLDVSASRTWSTATWSTEVIARVHRALNARETLIFGFPDPGRTFALHVRIRRAPPSFRGS